MTDDPRFAATQARWRTDDRITARDVEWLVNVYAPAHRMTAIEAIEAVKE